MPANTANTTRPISPHRNKPRIEFPLGLLGYVAYGAPYRNVTKRDRMARSRVTLLGWSWVEVRMRKTVLIAGFSVALAGCAYTPTPGPTVAATPGGYSLNDNG